MFKKRDPKQRDSKTKPTLRESGVSVLLELSQEVSSLIGKKKKQALVLWSVFLTVSH
jgi:NTP pyrophosphatase (non-canonical NTP hydrolase)